MSMATDAERNALGGILIAGGREWPDTLRIGDFSDVRHARVFGAMQALQARNEPVDASTVVAELGCISDTDMATYVFALSRDALTSANVQFHAQAVRREARRRDLVVACESVLTKARQDGSDADELLQHMVTRLAQLAEGRELTRPSTMAELVRDEYLAIEKRHNQAEVVGLRTGFRELDDLLGGLQPSGLVVIGARPGMGKTTLATNIVENLTIRAGKTALFFSLEMTKAEQTQRSLASEGMVDLHKIRTGKGFVDADWQKLASAMNTLSTDRLLLADKPGLDVAEVRAIARQAHSRRKLDVIAVDYLQLMEGHGQTREQEVSGISRGLKTLAMELQIPVIALSQLNRASEKDGTRPRLGHLRESGSLEQDASQVLLLHREQNADETEVCVAKNRNGPTGMVKLQWHGRYTRFASQVSR